MFDSPRARGLLLVLVGLALLAGVAEYGGYRLDDDAYRYEALRVSYDDGFLATDVSSGESYPGVDVSEALACEEFSEDRVCFLERALLENDTRVPARPSPHSDYRFLYLDGAFYRPTTVERDDREHLSLERVSPDDALRSLAIPEQHVRGPTRRAVESGSVRTFHELGYADELIRYEGAYYTLVLTGFSDVGPDDPDRGAKCRTQGEGFCYWAGVRRWAWTLGSAVGFVGGLGSAGYGLWLVLTNPAWGRR
jgi:hypothetical protein